MNESVRQEFWLAVANLHAPGAFAALDAAYTEPHRAYHTWEHIDALLERLAEFSHLAARPDLVATAVFWHDAVFDGRRLDAENVRESAELFLRHSLLGGREREAVRDMILATADHMRARADGAHYPGFSGDFDLFLDLDLSPLGAPWDEFFVNTRKIRAEASGLDDAEFCKLQGGILQSFASDDARLYRRAEFSRRWEKTARENLWRCIEAMKATIAAAR